MENRHHRLTQLQKQIKEQALDLALLHLSRDVYYYTGVAQPAVLLVSPDQAKLYVKSGMDFALEASHLPSSQLQEERRLAQMLAPYGTGAGMKVGTELDLTTVKHFQEMQKCLPQAQFVDLSPLVLHQRKTKEPQEVAHLEMACQALHQGHLAVLEHLRPGISELGLAAELEKAHRLAGNEGSLFIRVPDFYMGRGPMGSGPHAQQCTGLIYSVTGRGLSQAVPVGASRRVIAAGELVVVDVPVTVEGYHGDQSRTYVAGRATDLQHELYAKLVGLSDFAMDYARPGVTGAEIFAATLAEAKAQGVGEWFLSFGPGQAPCRMIGHGVGLEVNEPPILSSWSQEVIGAGYVLAMEMHLLHPQAGMMKIEDMFWVGEQNNRLLSLSPRRLIEVAG